MSPRVLLVEDDHRLATVIREYLEANGFTVLVESRGDTAVSRIVQEQPDAVILDLMLPGLDGLSVCRQVRASYRGAITMLTARGDDIDEVAGLEVGADDYLTKPVRPRVLLAHLNAVLRRVSVPAPSVEASPGKDRIVIGDLIIDAGRRYLTVRGAPIHLTTAEFDLLWYLAQRAGEVLNREEIYQAMRGIEYDGLDRSIDLRVTRIRRKIGDNARQPRWLKSVRGIGYMLVREP